MCITVHASDHPAGVSQTFSEKLNLHPPPPPPLENKRSEKVIQTQFLLSLVVYRRGKSHQEQQRQQPEHARIASSFVCCSFLWRQRPASHCSKEIKAETSTREQFSEQPIHRPQNFTLWQQSTDGTARCSERTPWRPRRPWTFTAAPCLPRPITPSMACLSAPRSCTPTTTTRAARNRRTVTWHPKTSSQWSWGSSRHR